MSIDYTYQQQILGLGQAADVVLGRSTAGGPITEFACTSAGRALIDDASASAQRTTLGLGTAAVADTGDFVPNDWTVDANTAITAAWGDRILSTGDNAQITLPDPASNGGKTIEVISTHANGADLIRNGSENINGAGSDQAVTQFERYTVISDGTNYIVNWNGVT